MDAYPHPARNFPDIFDSPVTIASPFLTLILSEPGPAPAAMMQERDRE